MRGIISRFRCVPCHMRAVHYTHALWPPQTKRMRDLQSGPDYSGRRVVRSAEAWRVEPTMAVGRPERRREVHRGVWMSEREKEGRREVELLIFCHCKLIYSMGPLLSPPPVVHASCALWGPRCSSLSCLPSALLCSRSLLPPLALAI